MSEHSLHFNFDEITEQINDALEENTIQPDISIQHALQHAVENGDMTQAEATEYLEAYVTAFNA